MSQENLFVFKYNFKTVSKFTSSGFNIKSEHCLLKSNFAAKKTVGPLYENEI